MCQVSHNEVFVESQAEALAKELASKYALGFTKEQLKELKRLGGDELLSPKLSIPTSGWGATVGAVGTTAEF